ncbi:hypothetical protein [Natrinema soli]|uniref:hypothetical protein n=1 Tax=Natrinema soli TaxID=1930624 RepID=UPI0023627338|nr:hypothetical protein [Natrinema soli]
MGQWSVRGEPICVRRRRERIAGPLRKFERWRSVRSDGRCSSGCCNVFTDNPAGDSVHRLVSAKFVEERLAERSLGFQLEARSGDSVKEIRCHAAEHDPDLLRRVEAFTGWQGPLRECHAGRNTLGGSTGARLRRRPRRLLGGMTRGGDDQRSDLCSVERSLTGPTCEG